MSFYVNHFGPVELLRSDLLDGVKHGFSTRHGGVSEGDLASLNLGFRRGDREENVRENYARFCAALEVSPQDLILAKQIHSDIVSLVGPQNRGEGFTKPIPAARDGLISNSPGTALVVFSADCAPVLLYDPVHKAIGAVHSGWRGTAQDIAGKAVRAMQEAFDTDPKALLAAVGPSLCQDCFQTDSDVPQAMRAQLGDTAEQAIEMRGNKYYVNNKRLIFLELLRAGLCPDHVDLSAACTACAPDRFWSYRKVGDRRGSLAALIAL